MSEKQLFIDMPDRVAKLVIAQLVDVGTPFTYQRMPGAAMSARVTVGASRQPTLARVHTLMKARLVRESTGACPV